MGWGGPWSEIVAFLPVVGLRKVAAASVPVQGVVQSQARLFRGTSVALQAAMEEVRWCWEGWLGGDEDEPGRTFESRPSCALSACRRPVAVGL